MSSLHAFRDSYYPTIMATENEQEEMEHREAEQQAAQGSRTKGRAPMCPPDQTSNRLSTAEAQLALGQVNQPPAVVKAAAWDGSKHPGHLLVSLTG